MSALRHRKKRHSQSTSRTLDAVVGPLESGAKNTVGAVSYDFSSTRVVGKNMTCVSEERPLLLDAETSKSCDADVEIARQRSRGHLSFPRTTTCHQSRSRTRERAL